MSPLETISPDLALGSYIVGSLNVDGSYSATANSGAIFETGSPPPPPSVPEPMSLLLLGGGLLGLGAFRLKRC